MGITATTRTLTPGEYSRLKLNSNHFTNFVTLKGKFKGRLLVTEYEKVVIKHNPNFLDNKMVIYNPVRRKQEREFDAVIEVELSDNTPLTVWFGVAFATTFNKDELALITCVFPIEEGVFQ